MDLNLYLGPGYLSPDLRMDLGRDLSLGPFPLPEPATPDPPRADRNDPAEDIFASITPSSPSRGFTLDAFPFFRPPFSSYHSFAQSPGNPYSPIFSPSPLGTDDTTPGTRSLLDIFRDAPPAQPSTLAVPPSGTGQVPYRPSYVPAFDRVITLPEPHEETTPAPPPPPPLAAPPPMGPSFLRDEISSSIDSLLRTPQLRFRTLIEYEYGRRERVGRQADFGFAEEARAPSGLLTCEEIANGEVATGGEQMDGGDTGSESMGNALEDKSRAVNYECNICLDMAKEPVVTSCGHLFCWPCLYQWLHLHSVHKECPVCKGEVDVNITPIYGRGSFESEVEGRSVSCTEDGLKIPPRPSGRRFESLRQQLHRPVSRRFVEGFTDPWRRSITGDWQNLARMDDASLRLSRHILGSQNERLETLHHRLRARRLRRVSDSLGLGTNAAMMDLPASIIADPPLQNGGFVDLDPVEHFRGSRVSVSSEAIRNEGVVDSSSVDGRISAPSASSTQMDNPEAVVIGNPQSLPQFVVQPPVVHSAAQASASSTLGLIQDDVGAPDALAEPNSGGSSRWFRRRRWMEASGSLDCDGGYPPARKRRRLN